MNRTWKAITILGTAAIITFGGSLCYNLDKYTNESARKKVEECYTIEKKGDHRKTDRCFLDAAILDKNPALCMKVDDSKIYDYCMKKTKTNF
jgi:hypothetical protein